MITQREHTTVSPKVFQTGENSLIARYIEGEIESERHTHTKRRRCYLPRNGALNLRPEAHCAGSKIKDYSDHLLIRDRQTDRSTHTHNRRAL